MQYLLNQPYTKLPHRSTMFPTPQQFMLSFSLSQNLHRFACFTFFIIDPKTLTRGGGHRFLNDQTPSIPKHRDVREGCGPHGSARGMVAGTPPIIIRGQTIAWRWSHPDWFSKFDQ